MIEPFHVDEISRGTPPRIIEKLVFDLDTDKIERMDRDKTVFLNTEDLFRKETDPKLERNYQYEKKKHKLIESKSNAPVKFYKHSFSDTIINNKSFYVIFYFVDYFTKYDGIVFTDKDAKKLYLVDTETFYFNSDLIKEQLLLGYYPCEVFEFVRMLND